MISYPLLLPKTSSSSSSSSFLCHGASSSVSMVSGLHPTKMNCSCIFNLFCLYGNVEKVRAARRPAPRWPGEVSKPAELIGCVCR